MVCFAGCNDNEQRGLRCEALGACVRAGHQQPAVPLFAAVLSVTNVFGPSDGPNSTRAGMHTLPGWRNVAV
jgi:hypothetical protein